MVTRLDTPPVRPYLHLDGNPEAVLQGTGERLLKIVDTEVLTEQNPSQDQPELFEIIRGVVGT